MATNKSDKPETDKTETDKPDEAKLSTEKVPAASGDGVGEKDHLTADGQKVQDAEDKLVAQGYRGVAIDPTPNENYTVAGVVAGKPTPETDEEQAAKVGSLKFR